jgi:hypothetical protein
MKAFFGVDYHKAFSYGTIMNETEEILKQGRFGNHPEALERFLEEGGGENCSAVLEVTRNRCVMYDWLEDLAGQVTLARWARGLADSRRGVVIKSGVPCDKSIDGNPLKGN